MQMFCHFKLRTRAFYAWHVHNSPYLSFRRKKMEPIMFHEGINAKVFRRSIAFAIAVVVSSSSSSFEYTISVHVGAERNVCNIVISTETPLNFYQSISNAAPRVQTSTLTPAQHQVPTSKTPTTFSSAFCAEALKMLVSGLVYRPKYTSNVYHLSTSIYVSVHESSGKT